MFTTEQNTSQKHQNTTKKVVFEIGTPLAGRKVVKKELSHKDFILAIGIVVAIIAFTLWAGSKTEVGVSLLEGNPSNHLQIAASYLSALQNVIKSSITLFF